MPRFALLCHDSPRGWHCDFFLERGELLRTWALPEVPQMDATLSAELLPDHRLIYLDYEGPISGNRGTVTRWDRGEYEVAVFQNDRVRVRLEGEKLVGDVELVRVDSERWTFTWTE